MSHQEEVNKFKEHIVDILVKSDEFKKERDALQLKVDGLQTEINSLRESGPVKVSIIQGGNSKDKLWIPIIVASKGSKILFKSVNSDEWTNITPTENKWNKI